MTNRKIIITEEAENDIGNIEEYIAQIIQMQQKNL